MTKRIFKKFPMPWMFVALGAALSTWPAAAAAKDHGKGAVSVLASVSFAGESASDMQLEQREGKTVLRVSFAGAQTRLIDVGDPERGLKEAVSTAREERTQLDQNLVLVRTAPEAPSAGTPAEELSLFDISRKGRPRLVQKFGGVVRVLEDSRGYFYILHRDGLSVIRGTNSNASAPDPGIYG